LLFHQFKGANEYNGLVRSVNFEYDTSTEQDFTFLKTITSYGYIKKPDGAYSHKKLPPMEFTYQSHDWNKEVKTIATEDLVHAPSGLDEQQYQFTDLYNEGLNGILTEQANGWYYKHNLGDGKFDHAKLVTPKPSFVGLGSVMQLADLDSDGGKQLVSYNHEPSGFFELDDKNEWQGFRSFKAMPNIDFGDANTRMLDLNGDGKPEVVISEDHVFTWYPSKGREGFSKAHKTVKPFDEEAGPAIVFADQKQTIFLADMSGSGMSDIVRIRNGEICYWPNLGYGKFGAKVAMDNAPVFDYPDAFNPSFIRLTDIDGSGTTDIVYLGKNKFTCWKNLSGNRFGTTPFEIDPFPEIHSQAKITVTDLLGNGVACIVWSSPLAKDANAPLKYIDLMNSKKPHIMVSYKNNMGKEVGLEYTPSTKFYLEDKKAGKNWVTKLHFPVHCISKTETLDKITGHRFVSSYKYHHGYYDHAEREFRGFGMVEQIDAETFEHWVKTDATNITNKDLHEEPVVSKSWHHTGVFLRADKILNQFENEYWFQEMLHGGNIVNHPELALPEARIINAEGNTISNLNTLEWREALRACKGMALRTEVFAKDAVKLGNTIEAKLQELMPYNVATHNCVIELLQPQGKNKHAVFVVKESEAITYSYERNIFKTNPTDIEYKTDPRIAHSFNIKLDEYSNVLESATVVYPRIIPDSKLPLETQTAQSKTIIIYAQNNFTNDVILDNVYRLRLPCETRTYELSKIAKSDLFYYSLSDFKNILLNTPEIPYHQIDSGTVTSKRLIEHARTNFYNNILTGALPLGVLEPLAIPYESYQQAYTPELLSNIFSDKIPSQSDLNDLMIIGKYSHSIDESGRKDNSWWVRSGTAQFLKPGETVADAQNRFFAPISYTDPYQAITKVEYYLPYYLFIEETTDALGNKAGVDVFNFRTLSPRKMKDINNNLSEVLTDELGLVKAMAVLGKVNEADDLSGLNEFTDVNETNLIHSFFNVPLTAQGVTDSAALANIGKQLLNHASARFVYDFEVYKNTGKPNSVASIVREEHFVKNNDSPVQLSFEYSNGGGQVVMKKVQAEPGFAKKVTVIPDDTYSVTQVDTSALVPKQLRWIGNGKTILNNKGNPVKQYEPYFSVNNLYEDFKELVETGVTPIMYYDAAGRLVKTEMPDGTFSKVEFDSWKQVMYDANDTVTDSIWYKRRTDITRDDFIIDTKEQTAAAKSVHHYNTPAVQDFDTLGRPILSLEYYENIETHPDKHYATKVAVDTEGNLRKVIDARGNTVMQYKYDMLGNLVYQKSMDAGQRWLLHNIVGNPLRTWDERNHEFSYEYDILHRPLQSWVKDGDGLLPLTNIFDKIIYGESIANAEQKNLRGHVHRHYDTGGLLEMPAYDFKGQPVSVKRKLYAKYKEVANWTVTSMNGDLEMDDFIFITETDALGRISKQIAPDKSIIWPEYNEAGVLEKESVQHFNLGTNSLDPKKYYIKNIDYNEKGQRNKITYGNDVTTKFDYDKETFRLKRLTSRRMNSELLQDLYYTYDAVGNITHIKDDAIPETFFNNWRIEPASEYTYDALYRLKKATGRENNAALDFGKEDNWNDNAFMNQLNPGDPMNLRDYIQHYDYDSVGNIEMMRHVAYNANWTRTYEYETNNNRLKTTSVGDIANPANYTKYIHHAEHGYLTEMPHLDAMGWNFKEELIKTIRQVRNDGGTPETTYYQYDGSGQRIRKITENTANAGVTPSKKDERIYISGYETYRTYQANTINFERESLSLMDEGHRFVMVETVKINTAATPSPSERVGERLARYQLHNHLGSAALELNENAQVISYERRPPYGTTAYQAKNKTIKAAAKRYRYTGMERDEETGLEYHSARYYLPWLGRWCSADPIGIGDGVNVFEYAHSNVMILIDSTGTIGENASDLKGIPWDTLSPPKPLKVGDLCKDNAEGQKKLEIESKKFESTRVWIDEGGTKQTCISGEGCVSETANTIIIRDDSKPSSLPGGVGELSSTDEEFEPHPEFEYDPNSEDFIKQNEVTKPLVEIGVELTLDVILAIATEGLGLFARGAERAVLTETAVVSNSVLMEGSLKWNKKWPYTAATDALNAELSEIEKNLSKTQLSKRVAISAGTDIKTGEVAVGIKKGEKGGSTFCAEDMVSDKLKPVTNDDIYFTETVLPSKGTSKAICLRCNSKYNNFPAGTSKK